jgi:hypothetical protein
MNLQRIPVKVVALICALAPPSRVLRRRPLIEQPERGVDYPHIPQQGAECTNRGRIAPDNQFDDALGTLTIECNNVFIYLLNHFIDQVVVILDRTR